MGPVEDLAPLTPPYFRLEAAVFGKIHHRAIEHHYIHEVAADSFCYPLAEKLCPRRDKSYAADGVFTR